LRRETICSRRRPLQYADPAVRLLWNDKTVAGRRHRHNLYIRALAPCIALALALWPPLSSGGDLSPVADDTRREFVLPDLDGQRVALGDYRGKVVLINFWASWCTPCVREMPAIVHLQAAMQDSPFQVIGINVGETPRRARTAANRLGLDFPVLLDTDSAVFKNWGAEVLPTTYVLDAEGVTRLVAFGPLDWDAPDIVTRLRLLAAPPPASHEAPNTPAGR